LVLAFKPVDVKVKFPLTVFIFSSNVLEIVAFAEVSFYSQLIPLRLLVIALSATDLSTLGLIPLAFKLASNSAIPS